LYLTTTGIPVVPLVAFVTSAYGGAVEVRSSRVLFASSRSSSGKWRRSATD
jgi:hypothetical protein